MAGHHFGVMVTQSLTKEAQNLGIELLVVDNRWGPDETVNNARYRAQHEVDFAIEFQVHDEVAPVIAQIFAKADIRTMALGVPQPGAIYFGANNYGAGLLGGEALARPATAHWRRRFDHVIFLNCPFVGHKVQSRFVGALKGIQMVLPAFDREQVTYLDAKDNTDGAHQATRKILRSFSGRDCLGIMSLNDDGAWGALRAVREAGRQRFTAVMGMGFDAYPSFVKEMRKPESPLIGSVAWFPEKYGREVLSIVTRCLNGEAIPPVVYTDHVLVTRENLNAMLVARKSTVEIPAAPDVGADEAASGTRPATSVV